MQTSNSASCCELPAVAEKDLASLRYPNLTVIQGAVTAVDADAKVGEQRVGLNVNTSASGG
jgi:hypothetical protein